MIFLGSNRDLIVGGFIFMVNVLVLIFKDVLFF